MSGVTARDSRLFIQEEARWLNTFYDSQIRRWLTQVVAIFSTFDVQFGSDPQGNPILHRVPVIWGDASRQAATIINNNSASNLPSVPLISVYVTGVEYDQKRTQDPYFVDKIDVRQRTYNQETGTYGTTQGNAFTVERPMPVPYTLRISVDFWTSNTQQQLELFEQISTLFNPSLELQSTDNFLDWTSLSVIYQDGIGWNSRTVPQGTNNPINIMSWKFYIPIWISSPVKVKKLGMIQKIIMSIHKGRAIEDMASDSLLLGTRQKITPYGYKLLLVGNKLQVLPSDAVDIPSNDSYDLPAEGPDTNIYWQSFLSVYGTVKPGVSMIAIENPYLETEILGTIDFDPEDDRLLTYTIDPDTLPSNTLVSVDRILDPNILWPDQGLPMSTSGQRYLIVADIPQQRSGVGGTNWPGLTGGAAGNDVIEYGEQSITTVSASNNVAGLPIINVSNISNICVGWTTVINSTTFTVIGIDYNTSTVTLNANLPVNLPYGANVTFSGSGWFISFDSISPTVTTEYLTNLYSGVQYRFVRGQGWMKSYEGYIDQGDYRIII